MLLEGLIAILIFSVGILAIVGMQAAAIKNSADAKYRSDASYLANQIIGEMWADRANLASYAHKISGTLCNYTGNASSNTNVTGTNGWLATVASTLPNAGTSNQQIVIGANNLVTVTVCWKLPQENVWHNFVATAQING